MDRPLDRITALAEGLRDSATMFSLTNGDALVNLGAFWDARYTWDFVQDIKLKGCAYIPFIYDILAVEVPELCEGGTVRDFGDALPRTLRDATAIITASKAVEASIRSYETSISSAPQRISVVPLAHQIPRKLECGLDASVNFVPMLKEPFVLCVGTFEPRKNQVRLAGVWADLSLEIEDLPTLVFVGKIGWLDASEFLLLDTLAQASQRIVYFYDIPDHKLVELFRTCLFSVYVPITEGWGLPVGESLAFHKACVASASGGIPEVGGEFPVYVDPLNPEAIKVALRRLVLDLDYRKGLEENIRSNFGVRAWSDFTAGLLGAVADLLRA